MAKISETRGAQKKEAFFDTAEAKIHNFSFTPPDVDYPDNDKLHIKLAGTDNCRAAIQILRNGSDNNLHYHPNKDTIYMVLKGRIRFYGSGDRVLGEYGPNEGLLIPENARYWFKSLGDEEAWLLQFASFPKGAKASRRVDCEPLKLKGDGVWLGTTAEDDEIRRFRKGL